MKQLRELLALVRRWFQVLWWRYGPDPPECPTCREPLRLTTFPESRATIYVCDECRKDEGPGILF